MELEQLRIFSEVARSGGFSPAARRLYVSHSTVSRSIAALERELGVELFARNSHGAVLTPAGELLREEGERLLAAAEAVAEKVKNTGRDEPSQKDVI